MHELHMMVTITDRKFARRFTVFYEEHVWRYPLSP